SDRLGFRLFTCLGLLSGTGFAGLPIQRSLFQPPLGVESRFGSRPCFSFGLAAAASFDGESSFGGNAFNDHGFCRAFGFSPGCKLSGQLALLLLPLLRLSQSNLFGKYFGLCLGYCAFFWACNYPGCDPN
ncbi:MAG: hypothetical protein WC100_20755, partial [Sterolibacterium sp.]